MYIRDELKDLVKSGYYQRMDYQWCYLDKDENKYVLMSEEEVKRLRSYFRTKESDEAEENILSAQKWGSINALETNEALINLRKDVFMKGRKDFQNETGYWPIKVPVYERCAWTAE